MTRNTLMSFELRRLLSGLSDSGEQHLAQIDTDLAQIGFLLGGAIEKLGGSFMAMHAAACAQQRALDLLLSGAATPPEIAEQLKAGREDMERHVNAAVTGLQFQDLISQLLGQTSARVAGMRRLLDRVGDAGSGMAAAGDALDVAAVLNDINTMLETQSARLEDSLRKAVRQTHMESGDVELF